MGGILVIAETRRGEVRDVSFELISQALALKELSGEPVSVVVIDASPDSHASTLGSPGVDEVLTVASPAAHFEAHITQRAVEEAIARERPRLVLAAHSIDGLAFAPAVAAVRGLGFASDVTEVAWENGPVAARGAYGNKLIAQYEFPNKDCTVLLLRVGSSPAAPAGKGDVPVRKLEVVLDGVARTEHVEFRDTSEGGVDITKADFLLAIGRGVEDEGNIERFAELATKLGATLSGSRPLVDAGWLASGRQVGQSGKTVKPRVYLAMGISGAVQHLAGMRSAELIIAVNTDPDAPIFSVAHYGAVADMFELADALDHAFS